MGQLHPRKERLQQKHEGKSYHPCFCLWQLKLGYQLPAQSTAHYFYQQIACVCEQGIMWEIMTKEIMENGMNKNLHPR